MFSKLTGLTAGTSAAIEINPYWPASICYGLTAGTPATGAKLQVTNSDPSELATIAVWVDYDTAKTTSQIVQTLAGNGCQFTGARLVVTDGTWTLQVRQAGE